MKNTNWGLLGLVAEVSADEEPAPTTAQGVLVSVTLEEPALSAPEGSVLSAPEELAVLASEEPNLGELGLMAPEDPSL